MVERDSMPSTAVSFERQDRYLPPIYGPVSTIKYTPAEWIEHNPNPMHRDDWSRFPKIAAQFDDSCSYNGGISVTQIPTHLSVVDWVWKCEMGHRWRETAYNRIGRKFTSYPANRPRRFQRFAGTWAACRQCIIEEHAPIYSKCGHRSSSLDAAIEFSELSGWCDDCKNGDLPVGEAIFVDHGLPSSKAELELRRKLSSDLPLATRGEANAVVVSGTSWGSGRVFPDILLPRYRIAVEYDSPGKDGDHHGPASVDIEKDAALRAAGWEVIRVRTGGLPPIGPYDVSATGPTNAAVHGVIEKVGEILNRGALANDGQLGRA